MSATPSTGPTEGDGIRTEYTTYVDGNPVYHGASLSDAARAWDKATVAAGQSVPGGVSVQSWNRHNMMVRDGWIMHVHNDGTVYLSPSIVGAS